MVDLLVKIIPLDLASTLSPGIFALSIVLLGSKFHPQKRLLSLFTGSLTAGIIITLLGLFLGLATPTGMGQDSASAIVDVVLGILFIGLSVQALTAKERQLKSPEEQTHQMLKWLIVGFAVSITNFDAAFLNFTAAKEVSGTAGINDIIKIILLGVNIVFFTLPITLPLFIHLIFPKWADHALLSINKYVLRYSRYIIFILFAIFGVYLTYRGIVNFF